MKFLKDTFFKKENTQLKAATLHSQPSLSQSVPI